jgi:hypothetical protein
MREKGPTKIKIMAIDPKKFFAQQNILLMPRAYESLNPGLLMCVCICKHGDARPNKIKLKERILLTFNGPWECI